MPILYRKDGSPVQVEDNAVQAYLSSGEYGVPASQDYALVTPDGGTVGVKGSELLRALNEGLRLENWDENKRRSLKEEAAQNEGQAFLAGAGRGLTFGLSDLAMTRFGMVDPEYLRQLREQNPTASTTGEIAGMVGGALLPGGAVAKGIGKALPAAVVGRLGAATAGRVEGAALRALTGGLETTGASLFKRATAKAAGLAAAGGVEGSLAGVGQAVTEKSLGDPREMGELLVASVGPAALVGGLAGGVFGGAVALGGAALGKLASKAEDRISTFVGEQAPKVRKSKTLEAIGLTDKQAAKIPAQKLDAGIDAMHDPQVTVGALDDGAPIMRGGAKTEEILDRAKQVLGYHGKVIEATIRDLDTAVERLAQAGDQDFTKAASTAAERPWQRGLVRVEQAAQEPGLVPAEGTSLGKARRPTGAYRWSPEGATVEGNQPSAIRDTLLPSKQRVLQQIEDMLAESEGRYTYKPYTKELLKIRQNISEGMNASDSWTFAEAQQQKVDFGRAFAKRDTIAGDKWNAWKDVYRALSNEIDTAADNALHAIFTKRGPETIAQLGDLWGGRAGEIEAQFAYSKKAYSALRDLFTQANKNFQSVGSSFARELAKGGRDFIKGLSWRLLYSGRGVTSAARMAGAAVGLRSTMGKLSEFAAPSKIAALANDTARLRSIQARAERYTRSIDESVGAILSGSLTRRLAPSIAWSVKSLTGDDDEQFQDKLRTYAADPNRLATQVGMSLGGLEDIAPNVSEVAATTLARAVQVMQEALPQPPQGPTLQPLLDSYKPSAAEMSRFRAVVAAALKPETVLSDIAHGVLMPEAVAAVERVYPFMVSAWRDEIAARAAALDKPLPYTTRLQLKILFNLPTDPTLDSGFIARSQAAWAPSEEQMEQKGSPPKLSDEAARRIFDNRSQMTTAQRIELGGRS